MLVFLLGVALGLEDSMLKVPPSTPYSGCIGPKDRISRSPLKVQVRIILVYGPFGERSQGFFSKRSLLAR